jgi:hypothetical protein
MFCLAEIFRRLRARAADGRELGLRQRGAPIELSPAPATHDHVVVNEDGRVERTAARIDEIIRAERFTRTAGRRLTMMGRARSATSGRITWGPPAPRPPYGVAIGATRAGGMIRHRGHCGCRIR